MAHKESVNFCRQSGLFSSTFIVFIRIRKTDLDPQNGFLVFKNSVPTNRKYSATLGIGIHFPITNPDPRR